MPFAGDLHYRRSIVKTRAGTPLLLIHGAGGSYLSWPAELRRLAGEDVLAVDLPGHGDSPGNSRGSISAYAQDMLDFLNQLKLDRAVICGHSMGGAIALQFCLEHPERAAGLILVGSGAEFEVNPKLIEYCESESTYPLARQLVVKFSFSTSTDPRLVELAAGRLAEIPAGVLRADLMACDGLVLGDRLDEIDQPALVICGEEDKMMPVSCSEFLVEFMPNARLEIISQAGHMVMLEQPGTVTQLIREFLEKIKLQKITPG